MYNVLDVCRFIINYCYEQDYNLSNLKLQKVLYFVQAFFVSNTDEKDPCFKERIEAWDFGPVVPLAYHEYKHFGSTNIPKVTSYIEFDDNNIWESKVVKYDDSVISSKDQELIKNIVDKFANYSTTTLVNVTHRQSPWMDVYEPGMNNVITIESIRRYFNG